MEIGLGPLGSAWMGWATALADPLIPEHIRAELHAAAASTAATQPAEWFTLTARLTAALANYVEHEDPWRTAGPPYLWVENTGPSNRFEWETDVLPIPTGHAATIITWALYGPPRRPAEAPDLFEAVDLADATDPHDAAALWPDCELAVRALAARARHNDPILDLRMTIIEEAWTAWISL